MPDKKVKCVAEPQQANGRFRPPKRLLEQYNRGYSTASELMLGVLTLTGEDEIREAVDVMPTRVLKKLEDFVAYDTPETKVFNGPPPRMETVDFVRALLARRKSRRHKNG